MLNDPFVQHQVGLLAFVIVLLLISLSNLMVLRRLGDYPALGDFPRLSILVPARNEEENIGTCVGSLLAQHYPNFEVIVLDDDSSDQTGHILAHLAAENERLQILEGDPLPPGWLGKNWACHQLTQRADGELLLFVDADTSHHPHTAHDAIAALVGEQADLISAIPHEQVITWAERLVVPVIPWSILSFLPIGLAHRLGTPALSAAIGQFMIFRRSAYAQVGGHEAVRQSVVDDLSLARRIKAAGLRWRLLDGTPRVRCRMYRGAGEVFKGVSRTLFAVFGNWVPIHLFIWFWLAVVFLEPLVVLALGLAGFDVPVLSLWLAGLAAGASLLLWMIAYHRFGIPHYLSLLYPVSTLLAVVIAVHSTISKLTRRGTWKGRPLAIMSQTLK